MVVFEHAVHRTQPQVLLRILEDNLQGARRLAHGRNIQFLLHEHLTPLSSQLEHGGRQGERPDAVALMRLDEIRHDIERQLAYRRALGVFDRRNMLSRMIEEQSVGLLVIPYPALFVLAERNDGRIIARGLQHRLVGKALDIAALEINHRTVLVEGCNPYISIPGLRDIGNRLLLGCKDPLGRNLLQSAIPHVAEHIDMFPCQHPEIMKMRVLRHLSEHRTAQRCWNQLLYEASLAACRLRIILAICRLRIVIPDISPRHEPESPRFPILTHTRHRHLALYQPGWRHLSLSVKLTVQRGIIQMLLMVFIEHHAGRRKLIAMAELAGSIQFVHIVAASRPYIAIGTNQQPLHRVILQFGNAYLADGIRILIQCIQALLGAEPYLAVPAF